MFSERDYLMSLLLLCDSANLFFWKQKIKQGRDIINSCYDPLRNTCKGGTNPLSTKITNVYELGKKGDFFALKTFF